MLAVALCCAGCFSEQSFRMQAGDLCDPGREDLPVTLTTRQWLRAYHDQYKNLLPKSALPALTTEQLADPAGKPVDVFRHFDVAPAQLNKLFTNYFGLLYSAQLVSGRMCVDEEPPAWPGFETVWIPMEPSISLSGRLGMARDASGAVRDADCIVILPGFFGDNGVLRSRDLADALLRSGHHVLAVELRGHGQTERRFPNAYYTFGVLETADLMKVSEWAEARPHVRRTGLIGYCWGANEALLASWYDGSGADDPDTSRRVAAVLPPRGDHRHFTAGIISFSPALTWERIVDLLEVEYAPINQPVLASLQNTIRQRAARKGHAGVGSSLRRLIECEFQHTPLSWPEAVAEAYHFLRFIPYGDKPAGPKLESARVPTLIVQAANDPMNPAQDVADLMTGISNPNVAALILPSGGHIGFAAWARAYYFNLIIHFFDPGHGPVAANQLSVFLPND